MTSGFKVTAGHDLDLVGGRVLRVLGCFISAAAGGPLLGLGLKERLDAALTGHSSPFRFKGHNRHISRKTRFIFSSSVVHEHSISRRKNTVKNPSFSSQPFPIFTILFRVRRSLPFSGRDIFSPSKSRPSLLWTNDRRRGRSKTRPKMWSKPDGLFKHRGLGSMSGFGVSGLGIYKRGFVREKAPF